MKKNLKEQFLEYAVKAKSVKDFCEKYHKHSAFHERGKDYMDFDIKSHIKDLNEDGYTIIPPSSSITGDIISFFGKKLNRETATAALEEDRRTKTLQPEKSSKKGTIK